MIRIISVGKKHDPLFEPAISHYQKRLHHHTKVEWIFIPHSTKEKESEKILSKITSNDFVILFDERGKNYTSEVLAQYLQDAEHQSKNIVCIIGGAYGVDASVSSRADTILGFGEAVFPHQMVRLMVVEQLYRSYAILSGSGYHHQ